jgi:hypothetical protein
MYGERALRIQKASTRKLSNSITFCTLMIGILVLLRATQAIPVHGQLTPARNCARFDIPFSRQSLQWYTLM